jgi:outer membrane receptor protein involved in Fe transport
MNRALQIAITSALLSSFICAQSPNATVAGRVLDPTNAVIPNARVEIINLVTGLRHPGQTNKEGAFVVPNLPPGPYRIEVSKDGFKTVVREDVVLRVQDIIALNFTLPVGSVAESVTVSGGAPVVNTESAAVSTVVDRQFVENIPLNMRSLQSLLSLVPGVVQDLTGGGSGGTGQFSINGQRSNANYFTIDGVSANTAASSSTFVPNQYSGTLATLTAFGTTHNLVSLDALEEFRIQTSTYAPEFGRTPGGQVSLVSRSGTNEFHGVLFWYFRNDALDANDWFANRAGEEKPALRLNQFGGVLGGPILKNRTFFFLSYEGLRLRQPQTLADGFVPSLPLRQSAPPDVQLLLNAFPLPTGPEFGTTGKAPFVATYSDPSTINATSLRIDHTFGPRLRIFGRYNQTPSRTSSRNRPFGGFFFLNPAGFEQARNETRALTLGVTLSLSPRLNNEFRANYTRDRAASAQLLDDFGGAVPITLSQVVPPFIDPERAEFNADFVILPNFDIFDLDLRTGNNNLQRQLNLVNNLSYVIGRHQFKFGVDYRRLAPRFGPAGYLQLPIFFEGDGAMDITNGTVGFALVFNTEGTSPLFTNFSAFAQDTWKVTPRFTLTYGLRWDVNPAPTEADGKQPFIVRGLDDLGTATAVLLPPGERLWETRYDNFAPRVGVAYQLSQRPGWEIVVRGGFGLFHDLGSNQGSDALVGASPFQTVKFTCPCPYPLPDADAAPTPFSPPFPGGIHAFDPNLKLPLTYQWNVALEQSLGASQSFTASYVAAVGRRLLETKFLFGPLPAIPDLGFALITTNGSTSDYHALQLQFQRRLSRGLQALASYTWSHAIDEISGDINNGVPTESLSLRGNADFDVRHVFSAAITYEIPSPIREGFGKAVLGNWAIDANMRAQSAYPFTPNAGGSFDLLVLPTGEAAFMRPNLVPGVPLYIDDPNAPGGRRVNPAAFQIPPPGEQGNAGRNILRGFSLNQVDFALRRRFQLGERLKLLFRAEAFNLFNHPNFANPVSSLTNPLFGEATRMQGVSLGVFPGGPRSMQFALRFEF